MSCCSNENSSADIDGECPECGRETIGGEAYDDCVYSAVECETCGARPCDGSC